MPTACSRPSNARDAIRTGLTTITLGVQSRQPCPLSRIARTVATVSASAAVLSSR
jgi:hypothetical protein